MEFSSRLEMLSQVKTTLFSKKNEVVQPGNGIYEKYKYPVVTADHAPLHWEYDLDPATNPYLMKRFAINATAIHSTAHVRNVTCWVHDTALFASTVSVIDVHGA